MRADSDSRHTGGVLCYVRNDIVCSVLESIMVQRQYWMLMVKIIVAGKSLIIGILYRSPSGSKGVFLDFLEDICDRFIVDKNGNSMIMGDFNIKWNGDDTYSRRLKKGMSNRSLVQVVKESTCFANRENESTIDLVFTKEEKLTTAKVLNDMVFGNHRCIKISIDSREKEKVIITISRGTKIRDIQKFRNDMKDISYEYRTNINARVNNYYEKLKVVRNNHMPIRETRIYSKGKHWFDSNVMQAIKERDKGFKKYRLTMEEADWQEYKRLRNQTVNIIKRTKTEYYTNHINDCMYDAKKMWKTIKRLMKNEQKEDIMEIVFKGETVKGEWNIAEEFNNYFIDSIEEVINTIPHEDFELNEFRTTKRLSDFKLLSMNELYDIVRKMKNKTSPDGIDTGVLLLTWEEINNPLLNFINGSMEVGTVPKVMKISTIVPIQKVKKSVKCEEFRPINMLSSLSKIMEQVVCTQIRDYIEGNNLLTQYQSGFREGHSCETAIQGLIHHWKKSIDEGLITCLVFLDLKRAFETINKK